MAVKCEWGWKLEPHEIEARQAEFDKRAEALKAELERYFCSRIISSLLIAPKPCYGCPNQPSECPTCRVDAMMPNLEQPAITVTITE